MKYAFMAGQASTFAASAMCHAGDVSGSGYYAWRRRAPSPRAQAEAALTAHIQTTFVAGRGVYGSPRIPAARRRHGIRCGRKRVARLMRAQGLCATRPRRRKPRTTDSQHSQPVAPNLLARNFTASGPNRKWVADITAIATHAGWLYLAGILDVYSRRAIGYAMDTTRDERLVEAALHIALADRRPSAGLVHYSDCGSQYTNHGHRDLFDFKGIVLSIRRNGEAHCNALLWNLL